jgi:hypothetical protein
MTNVLSFKKAKPSISINSGEELLSLFNLFEENFQKGEKSVAFSSTNYRSSQEKSVLLAVDYFNKKYPSLKIAVVSFKLDHGLFKEYLGMLGKDLSDTIVVSRNFSLIDWNPSLKMDPLDIVDEYDMIFWDLPDLDFIQKNSEDLSRFFETMDALYIVSIRFEKFDEEHFKKTIYNYYLDHGLDIKMIIPWRLGSKKRPAKKSLLEKIKALLM